MELIGLGYGLERHLKNRRYVERDQQNHGAAKANISANIFDQAIMKLLQGLQGKGGNNFETMVP